LLVRKNAYRSGSAHRLFRDRACVQLAVLHQNPGRGQGKVAARADGDDPIVGLDHVSGPRNHQRAFRIRDDQKGIEPPQDAIGPPILGQLNRGALQVAIELFQLRFELLKKS
jgi:hypothetical protein